MGVKYFLQLVEVAGAQHAQDLKVLACAFVDIAENVSLFEKL